MFSRGSHQKMWALFMCYYFDMKKLIYTLIVVVFLALAWWLGSPLFIDTKVSEQFVVESDTQIVSSGTFTGFDALHQGSGTVNLIKTPDGYVVRFEDDFASTNGPDLYVGFGKDGVYQKGSEISELKGNIGSQNYVVPAEIDLNQYDEVWVWCKAFSVPFARAELKNL